MKETKDILKALHISFSNGIRAAKTKEPREWLESKGLSIEKTGACFSSGQTHHRREQAFIDELLSVGFLMPSNAAVRSPELKAYTSFGKEAIIFALRNQLNEVVNFSAIRIFTKDLTPQHLNQDGIYPSHPHQLTERLYITDNVLDAATLLESKILGNRDAVMALANGKMSDERHEAINKLSQLKEIIFIPALNSKKSLTYQYLCGLYGSLKITYVELPEDHSLNDMWVDYGLEGLQQLLDESKEQAEVIAVEQIEVCLNRIAEGKLSYEASTGTYYVLGNLSTDLGNLKATIHFEELNTKRKHRAKPDLYDRQQLVNFAKSISEGEGIDQSEIEAELLKLTDLLEAYRDEQLEAEHGTKQKPQNLLPPEKEKESIEFLSETNLIQRIDKLIETSGIVGEENNRKMIFVIASTYKMLNPLHGLIQGTSGSGKTHLVNGIANLMPPEDLLNMTRITSKSLYHYKNEDLINKLVLIQDIDGLDEEAMFAFREMQSAGFVSSSTTYKNKSGQLVSTVKRVNAKFASLVATTHAEIYFDNLSRSIILGVNESEDQTKRIILYQNQQTAGLLDALASKQAKELLQNCIRTLKPYEVVNRYADKLQLPVEAKMLRRLNNHYQDFVKQITLLHQYQRNKDEQGRLISTKEDLKLACEILFDAIMWKIDELDSSLRQFFEQLKNYVKKKNGSGKYHFSTREVRQAFNLSRSQVDRYIQDLKHLEYIQIAEGSANKGYKYLISYWDDMEKVRQKVKDGLLNQINQIQD